MLLKQFKMGPYDNFTYVIAPAESRDAVVIDPSFGIDPVLHWVDEEHLRVRYILNTHSHPDHVAGNSDVKARTGARIAAHRSAKLGQDVSLDDGDSIHIEDMEIKVIHTPGHTPDSVLYLVEDRVATGDTLFVGECGRTDLPGGDPGALFDSLFGKVVKLEDAVVVLPGHDYGRTPTSTIGYEKLTNYVLQPRTREEFIRFLRT